MQRRRFTLEFKQQVIQEAKEIGNASQVARRHNINPKVSYRWMKEAEHTDWQQTDRSSKMVKAIHHHRRRCLFSKLQRRTA